MKRLVMVAALVIGLAMTATAQDSGAASKLEDIRRLIRMTNGEKLQQEMLDQVIAALRQSMPLPSSDGRSKKIADRLVDLIREEYKKVDFSAIVIELYDKNFTADEIKGLIQFYESPVGQKSIQVFPNLMRESMAHGMELGRVASEKAMARWLEEYPELKNSLAPPAR